MKNIVRLFSAFAVVLVVSCNNNGPTAPEPATQAQNQHDSGGRGEHSIDPGAVDTIQTPSQMESI